MELRLLAALPTLAVFGWTMCVVINDLAVLLASPPTPPRNPLLVSLLRRERWLVTAVAIAAAQAWFWTVLVLA
jgi:hypothetical protein